MFGERHDLHHEFPEHAELIHQLLGSHQEFAALYRQYDEPRKLWVFPWIGLALP